MFKTLFGSDESKKAGAEAIPATAKKFLDALETMVCQWMVDDVTDITELPYQCVHGADGWSMMLLCTRCSYLTNVYTVQMDGR